jgi:hypothetical protein
VALTRAHVWRLPDHDRGHGSHSDAPYGRLFISGVRTRAGHPRGDTAEGRLLDFAPACDRALNPRGKRLPIDAAHIGLRASIAVCATRKSAWSAAPCYRRGLRPGRRETQHGGDVRFSARELIPGATTYAGDRRTQCHAGDAPIGRLSSPCEPYLLGGVFKCFDRPRVYSK